MFNNSTICRKWRLNPTVNPRTGRKIQVGKGVYNELLKECGPLDQKEPLARVSPPKPLASCYKQKKAECLNSQHCQWIVGTGCRPKKVSSPKPVKKIVQEEEVKMSPPKPVSLMESKTPELSPNLLKLPRMLYSGESVLEEKMKDPNWIPYWKSDEYFEIAQKSLKFIINKYKNKVDICFSGIGVIVTNPFDFEYELIFEPDNFDICMSKNTGLSIFEIAIKIEGVEFGHNSLLVLNNKYKTIEYYDPQSNNYDDEEYRRLLGENIENILKKTVKKIRPEYKFISMYDTCPLVNFQVYEASGFIPKNLKHEGFCMLWSAFFCHLRILYHNKTQDEFYDILEKIYNEMLEGLETKRGKLNPFAKFIYEYALYFERKYKKK